MFAGNSQISEIILLLVVDQNDLKIEVDILPLASLPLEKSTIALAVEYHSL
ncbi:MAG: hypothetical protein P0116_07115 [Candidatus Nitrosocosmicus sp.]|nr:hypothetical protein [Candidatus Nitrosocosmicus sp.]